VAAVQDPELCLLDLRLRRAVFRINRMGLPVVKSGQVAAVFPLTVDGESGAARFFTAPTEQSRRYAQLDAFLGQHPCPLFVTAEWVARAVALGDGVYPAVLMPWVPGLTLTAFVEEAIEDRDTARLNDLSTKWLTAADVLTSSTIVHGDLQHGNVLVDESLTIRLIDYDGVWVPGLDRHNNEVGHLNYQHPQRLELDESLVQADAFSAFVIYLSLRATAADPSLWDEFNGGENMLFMHDDFVDAGRRERKIWQRLSESAAPDVRTLSATLEALCRIDVRQIPTVAQLAVHGTAALAGADPYVPERSSRSAGGQWWQPDGNETAGAKTADTTGGADGWTSAPYSPSPDDFDPGGAADGLSPEARVKRFALFVLALAFVVTAVAVALAAAR
ncbi:MAG TPA: hypothetical protein VGM93_01540, partial [Acidimicrobiales bacterium]